ncbi:O-antigen/teichoic acid export membrane protein [Microbacterium halimionae]|uniref:O-antigen/teichoic acid export membrane protein n=1 Tax=Microbacterium halimionae TaxID=1526413 RepID=A0A7W3JPR6_9MICO|nr:oligosaccharide flippase family protein [Microbacterium halimionae]MBA8816797.1 O-antigen/teichoic acid export membrane protein [Microbacterium halimionae]NII94907.1 O-antigen/teichoic acid export membrane protein [Microbacterium halimionae]
MSGLARQAFTVLFGRGVVRVAQFVAFLVLARLLSPTDFGWFGILTSAITLAATLGSLGLRQSFAYEIGQDRITPGQAAGTSLALWPVLSLIAAAVIFAVYGRQISGIAPAVAAVIILLGVSGAILHTLLQGIFLGRGVIWAFSLSDALPRITLMLGVLAIAFMGVMTLDLALWVQVGSYLITLPVIVVLAVWQTGPLGTAFRRLLPMLRYGLIFALNLFLVTLCSRLSMFVIEATSGADSAGQFFAAIRVNEIFLEIATALGMVLFSNAVRSTDSASSIKRGIDIASWLFWLFMLLAVPVSLLAPSVLTLLIGSEYAGAVPALQILAFSLAPTAASRMVYPTLAGSGSPFFGTPVIAMSLMLNGALALILVPQFGIAGGAIAVTVGQYALLVGYAITCRIRFNIPIHALFLPRWGQIKQIGSGLISRLRKRREGPGDEKVGDI